MQNCYNTKQKEQDDRLTNKHIKTLSFLQEIVEENKQLKSRIEEYEVQCAECGELHEIAKTAKQRIAQIQEQYLARADEINAILLEKHKLELMKLVDERVDAEKSWDEEKRALLEQIAQSKKDRTDQEDRLLASKDHAEQIKILELKVDALNQEIDRIKEKNTELEKENKQQLTELQRLHHADQKGSNLSEEVKALQQHNKELEFKIAKLNEELSERGSKDQEEALNSLRGRLNKIISDQSAGDAREKEQLKSLENLRAENENLRRALSDSERMRKEMHQQLDEVLRELALLKKQLASRDREKENFKEFVQMKRDLQILQEENDMLKAKASKKGSGKLKKNGQLPSLTDSNTTYKRLGSASKDRIKPPSYGMLFQTKT